jgi:hypothetical protein
MSRRQSWSNRRGVMRARLRGSSAGRSKQLSAEEPSRVLSQEITLPLSFLRGETLTL